MLNDFFRQQIPYPVKDRQKSGESDWIYLFYNHSTKLHKIGITIDVYSRHKEVEANCGTYIAIINAIQMEPDYDESARLVESTIHKYFKSKRKRGEWFDLNVRDLIELDSLIYYLEGNDVYDGVALGSKLSYYKEKYNPDYRYFKYCKS